MRKMKVGHFWMLMLSICLSLADTYDERMLKEVQWEPEHYKYLSYDEMRSKLQKLKVAYPNLIKIESSEEKYGLPHYAQCGDHT